MANSYSTPLTYGQPNGALTYDGVTNGYNNQPTYSGSTSSAMPATIVGALVGGGVGAYIGNKKNPYIFRSGVLTDTFAKAAYERYIDKTSDAGKEAYSQTKKILKAIDKIKTSDELKTLFNSNKEAAQEICNELKQTPDEFLDNITKDNLKENKKVIKEKLQVANKTRYQNMKNQLQACWDKDTKKFVKAASVNDDAFKSLRESTRGIKSKIIAKYAAIGGITGGLLTYIASKIFTSSNNISQ